MSKQSEMRFRAFLASAYDGVAFVQPEVKTQTMKTSRRRSHTPLPIMPRIEKRSQVERKKMVSEIVRLAPIAEIAEMLTWISNLPTVSQSKYLINVENKFMANAILELKCQQRFQMQGHACDSFSGDWVCIHDAMLAKNSRTSLGFFIPKQKKNGKWSTVCRGETKIKNECASSGRSEHTGGRLALERDADNIRANSINCFDRATYVWICRNVWSSRLCRSVGLMEFIIRRSLRSSN